MLATAFSLLGAQIKYHYVGYGEHWDAWSVWFSGKGMSSTEPFCLLVFHSSYCCIYALEQVLSIFEDLGIAWLLVKLVFLCHLIHQRSGAGK
jgi:hypothetical protein